MDENEYRATYHEINRCRCVFEKALNSRVCSCNKSSRFNLADREGVACDTPAGQALCTELLQLLRHNARFTLHLTRIDGPLPHASEIRIQNGGLLGLQKALSRGHQEQPNVGNIHGLIAQAIARYENLDNLPYLDIVKSVLSYTIRQKRPKY
jgi:hypothetical protein